MQRERAVKELPTLWYENHDGKRWIPDEAHYRQLTDPPEGFVYQWCRFPRALTTTITKVGGGRIGGGETHYHRGLVLAMCRPSLLERLRTIWRGYAPRRALSFDQAVLHSAVACERCLNALAWRWGTDDGYPEGSAKWHEANTRCELCDPR